jgi:hypothetical protein
MVKKPTNKDQCRAYRSKGNRCRREVTGAYMNSGGGSVTHHLCVDHNKQRLDGIELSYIKVQTKYAVHVSTGARKKPCTKCGEIKWLKEFCEDSHNASKGTHEGKACWCKMCQRTKGNRADIAERVKQRDAKAAKDVAMLAKGKLWCSKCKDDKGSYRLEKFFGADNHYPSRNWKNRYCKDCANRYRREAFQTPAWHKRQKQIQAVKERKASNLAKGFKICGLTEKNNYGCQKRLGLSHFSKRDRSKNGHDGYGEICRTCEKRRKEKLYAERPAWYQHKQWQSNIRHNYNVFDKISGEVRGMTQEDWCEMWVAQKGLCALCYGYGEWHERFKMSALYVDHDHETGLARGLTCASCNTALGHAHEDPERLRRMADYLELSTAA